MARSVTEQCRSGVQEVVVCALVVVVVWDLFWREMDAGSKFILAIVDTWIYPAFTSFLRI